MDVIAKDVEVSNESIADIFVAIDNILNKIGIKHTFLISDRRIWDVIADERQRAEAMALVDKKSKMSDEKFAELLVENPNRAEIEKILNGAGQMDDMIKFLQSRGVENVKLIRRLFAGCLIIPVWCLKHLLMGHKCQFLAVGNIATSQVPLT